MYEERPTGREEGAGRVSGPDSDGSLTVPPRRAIRRARWAEAVMGASLLLYIVLAVLAYRFAYFEWDLSIALGIQRMDFPGFQALMVWLSALGSGWVPIALVAGTGFALAAAGFKTEGVICVAGVASGGLLNMLLKMLSARPRPSESLVHIFASVKQASFPSGHVVFFIEYFGILFFFAYVLLKRGPLRQLALITTGAMISLIGVSRIYLGAHWPSDVVGAYLAGGIWLMLMIEAYRRMKGSGIHGA
ncbi:MAG TPA: phosphatase PAP2 family protein [Blastocatellia bacterium]|jgi:undecaprenyl-diphosphatase|nr:phosphatase PAP2 family protein [Blastocatellia bacterium]